MKTAPIYLALALLVMNQQAFAEPGTERLTLMLSGTGCEASLVICLSMLNADA
jgi:hypothetical protein